MAGYARFRSPKIWLAAYFLLTTAVIFGLAQSWTYDDPFISYRYAENLADGLGLVYNPEERTLSTTAPLFAIALAALRTLWDDIPRLAIAIGSASLAGGAIFLWGIARELKLPLAAWAALLLYPTFQPLFLTLGSEAPLMLFFLCGAYYLYLRKRFFWMGLTLALAVLTRADAILAAGILGLDWTVRTWRSQQRLQGVFAQLPWTAVIGFLGPLALWVVPATLYFGSPLPITLTTKQAQGLMDISTGFGEGLLIQLRILSRKPQGWPEITLLLGGVMIALVQRRRWLLLIGWSALYSLAYVILGVTNYFWYYAPLAPGLIAAIGLALGTLGGWKLEAEFNQQPYLHWGALFILVVLAGLQIGEFWAFREQRDPRYPAYRAAGEWLSENTAPSAKIGTLEVGVIGYHARPRPMVDFAGLIQPEVAEVFGPKTNYQTSARWAVETYRPDYLVLQRGLFPILEAESLSRGCVVIQVFPKGETGYSFDLEVYDCRG